MKAMVFKNITILVFICFGCNDSTDNLTVPVKNIRSSILNGKMDIYNINPVKWDGISKLKPGVLYTGKKDQIKKLSAIDEHFCRSYELFKKGMEDRLKNNSSNHGKIYGLSPRSDLRIKNTYNNFGRKSIKWYYLDKLEPGILCMLKNDQIARVAAFDKYFQKNKSINKYQKNYFEGKLNYNYLLHHKKGNKIRADNFSMRLKSFSN